MKPRPIANHEANQRFQRLHSQAEGLRDLPAHLEFTIHVPINDREDLWLSQSRLKSFRALRFILHDSPSPTCHKTLCDPELSIPLGGAIIAMRPQFTNRATTRGRWRLVATRCHISAAAPPTRLLAQRCVNSTARLNGQPVCTKVECQRCFLAHGWDWAAADADPRWQCTQCRGVCPRARDSRGSNA